MSQHHDRRQQQSSGVGKTLASNIGGRTVDSLKDRNLVTHVTGGSQTQTANETRGQIRQDITVQVRHNHDVLLVRSRVGDETETGGVNELRLQSKLRVLLGEFLGSGQEQTVRDLHNGGLVDGQNLGLANGAGVLKGVTQHTLRGLLGDELDRLHNTRDDNVLDTTVLTLGVLSDQDGINAVVGGLVADNGLARADVGEQVEGSAEGQVKGDMALSDRGCKGSLEGDEVLADGVDGGLGDGGLAIDEDGGDVDGFPLDGDLGGLVDVLDGLGDLDTDTITFDQSDSVVALKRWGLVTLRWDRKNRVGKTYITVLLAVEGSDRGGIGSLFHSVSISVL